MAYNIYNNEAEQKAGTRMSCHAEIWGDAQVWLPDTQVNENYMEQILF